MKDRKTDNIDTLAYWCNKSDNGCKYAIVEKRHHKKEIDAYPDPVQREIIYALDWRHQ